MRILQKILGPNRGIILVKKNRIIPLVCTYCPLIVNICFEFQVYMFNNDTDMTKCHSFCTTTSTTTTTTTRLWQYFRFSPKQSC